MRRRPDPTTQLVATLALGLASVALGCSPEDAADDGAAALVPADAAALEAYLKQPAAGRFDAYGWEGALDVVAAPPGTPGDREADFSTTTLQTAGVDEADLVKFDGDHLFVARSSFHEWLPDPPPGGAVIRTVSASVALTIGTDSGTYVRQAPSVAIYSAHEDPAEAEPVHRVALGDARAIDGMLLLPGSDSGPPLLVVIASEWNDLPIMPPFWRGLDGDYWAAPGGVKLYVFDVRDAARPRLIHRSKVEGRLLGVRRIGRQLVLVTSFVPLIPNGPTSPRPWLEVGPHDDEALAELSSRVDQMTIEELLPRRWLEYPGDGEPEPLVRPRHCFVPKERADADARLYYGPSLVTISSIDLRAPDDPVSICVAGPYQRMFSSTGALYLAAVDWSDDQHTLVHKFAYTDRGPKFRGSGRAAGVPGGSDPDFGMGEIGGAFGIMTTVTRPESFERSARLTLLAEAGDGTQRLEEISHLPNEREPAPIGKPGEQLYAVRFLGDRIYAVTFRRIDPLYVIDASDPRRPFIAGELEVPGFSDSLHPVGPDLLLGIGKDSIEDDGVDWFQGVKIELFDVADPSAPQSVDALVIGARGSETAARTDHHAFTALDMGDGTSRVAIPISVTEGEAGDDPRTWHPWTYTGLHLFEVDHDTPALHEAGALVVSEAGDEGGATGMWNDRSRLQGEAVHYVHGEQVWSADWDAPGDAVGPQ